MKLRIVVDSLFSPLLSSLCRAASRKETSCPGYSQSETNTPMTTIASRW